MVKAAAASAAGVSAGARTEKSISLGEVAAAPGDAMGAGEAADARGETKEVTMDSSESEPGEAMPSVALEVSAGLACAMAGLSTAAVAAAAVAAAGAGAGAAAAAGEKAAAATPGATGSLPTEAAPLLPSTSFPTRRCSCRGAWPAKGVLVMLTSSSPPLLAAGEPLDKGLCLAAF